MSNYSTIVEAWGCENFKNKKKRKKRRKIKEKFQDYEQIHQGQNIVNQRGENVYGRKRKTRNSRPLTINRMSSRSIEPIKIKLEEDEADYEGYNSSDYDQYELEDTNNYSSLADNNQELKATPNPSENVNDTCVLEDTYEPNEVPYQEEYETYYGEDYNQQYQKTEQAPYENNQYHQLDPNVIKRLYNILDKLEDNAEGGENLYDVLLFVFFGVFILFIIDYMYKIGVRTSTSL